MPRYFLELSYCGTNYNGWQIQSNTPNTVQHILSEILSTTLRERILLIGCGRTDAGVHATQFFAHFDSDTLAQHPFDFWIHKWNSMLPHDIAVHKIIPVVENAHSRYDATSRTYQYHIHQKKNPFLYQYSYYYSQPLNHDDIIQAIQILKKHSDFACFTKDANEYENTLCTIYDATWQVSGDRVVFIISANRFLRNMVRSIVGTLLWLGIGKISLQNFEDILLSKDRKNAGFSATARGLHITKITYPPEIFVS